MRHVLRPFWWGDQYAVSLSYAVRPSLDGPAQAFIIGEAFIDKELCAMILDDNIFYGNVFLHTLRESVK